MTDRNTCASDGCNKPVRTKHSMYCKDCHKKVRAKPRKEEPTLPPGQYECYWCGRTPRAIRQVTINHLDEDYSSGVEGNAVYSCLYCHKNKQRVIFWMKGLKEDRYKLMLGLIPYCRDKRY